MTLQEAILKSLEEVQNPATAKLISRHLLEKKYWKSDSGKTPEATIQSRLGDFIRDGDIRINRLKRDNIWQYYLTENSEKIDIGNLKNEVENKQKVSINKLETQEYKERDLHILLSTFLKNKNIYSKTILHEKSNFLKDKNQTWLHPDMVGIDFLQLQNIHTKNLNKAFNINNTFKIYSFELKREINSDTELKEAFFQANSNSSWANYGYLVALEFSDNLINEMARLNDAFGIGIIKLNANPFQSKILFSAKQKELDFRTIDKLCEINSLFEEFVQTIEKHITVDEKYFTASEKELETFSDIFLKNDEQVKKYCKEKNIPMEFEDEE